MIYQKVKDRLFGEINYYGYSYPGHETDNYYVATQLLIWQIVDKWYDPYLPDGVTH